MYKIVNYVIALVWFVNGFLCKIINLVPRHETIVANILGDPYAREITLIIGILEVFMGVWILSGKQKSLILHFKL